MFQDVVLLVIRINVERKHSLALMGLGNRLLQDLVGGLLHKDLPMLDFFHKHGLVPRIRQL